MTLEQSTLQVVYGVSVVTSIALCGVLWRNRDQRGAIPLCCYVFSGLLWGGIQLANVTYHEYAISAALIRLLYVGIAFGVASLFVFALEYTGRERFLGPKTYLALSVHPLFVLVSAIADPGGFFFGTIHRDPSVAIAVTPEYGPGLLIHLVYSYALVVASVLMFVDMLYRTRSLYRGQSVALIGGAILPAVPPLAALTGVAEFDATPIAIPIASALFTIAIVRYRLIDLVPIARDRVLDTVNDGVFVVDTDDRLIDANPEGRRILQSVGIEDESLVGREVHSLLEFDELRRHYETITAEPTETTTEVSIGPNHFRVTATPIDDGRDRHVGWLVIAHDITERKRRERRLERQNERLEQFADLVSHDLRNPLTVANGYLELVRETDIDDGDGAEYLEKIANSHDRMETIIDDVLTLAREGAAVTDPEPVALGTIADRAWEGVETGAASLELRSDARLLADPDRLQRLLENLFRNSLDHGTTDAHTESDLVVAVGVETDGRRPGAGFYVEDNGPGIPPDQRDRVFEDGYTTSDEGTGFGLSIVRQIADAHGWSVAVTDGTTGGARFEFTGLELVHGDGSTESAYGISDSSAKSKRSTNLS